jgi:AP-1 complex subunit mu
LRDNFVIIYELLDEMMDFGYPQLTETKILKEYITQQSFKLEKSSKTQLSASDQLASKASQAGTSVVSWRPEGIKYRKNEVFLDVIESVNLTVNSHGQIVKNEVMGSVKIRCYLSGMPELKLGLNDKILFDVRGRGDNSTNPNSGEISANTHSSSQSNAKAVELEHVKFHQCVKLAKFEQDRTISFIPPDGDFELLSYRVTASESASDLKPLFWIDCKIVKFTQSTLEYLVTAKSQFKRRTAANNVTILVPVPKDADTPRLKASIGSAHYAPELDSISWNIGFFPGGKEFSIKIKVGLPSVTTTNQVESSTLSRPISLSFEIPYYTMSGIQVRYLKIIEKSGYPALPWVRYITNQGVYEFRMPEHDK